MSKGRVRAFWYRAKAKRLVRVALDTARREELGVHAITIRYKIGKRRTFWRDRFCAGTFACSHGTGWMYKLFWG